MNASLNLRQIRSCFEGAIPASILTCATDGTVNITHLSHVYYIDANHVALSVQFFNKTGKNLLQNPHASLMLMDPTDLSQYLVDIEYLHTEAEGPVFDRMACKLADIAAMTGMESVFKLQGAAICRVTSCQPVKPDGRLKPAPRLPTLEQVSAVLQLINQSRDLECMFENALAGLDERLGYAHSIIFLKDHRHDRLYTMASRGYGASGVGSELVIGEGVAGVAAKEQRPIRLTNVARELTMSRAIQERIDEEKGEYARDLNIPLPGLAGVQSVVAVPLLARGELLGVISIESEEIMAFFDEDVDALSAVAQNLAMALSFYQSEALPSQAAIEAPSAAPAPTGESILVRCYEADHSVFIGGDYLIKGVAGCILWKLLCQWRETGQVEFTNRELRLDPDINLPEIGDNLEARLILLRKRLEERSDCIHLEKRGRGRFALIVSKPLELRFIARD